MSAYNKMIAAVVGGVLSWVVGKYGLPVDWAGSDMQAAITTVITAVVVYAFPANKTA